MRSTLITLLTLIGIATTSGTARADAWPWGNVISIGGDAHWEFLAASINDYTPVGGGNLSNCIPGGEAFSEWMDDAGFYGGVMFTDDSAWASHYAEAMYDDDFNDSADVSYQSGHGNSGRFYFGNATYPRLDADETRWGDVDSEFVVFDSCMTLDYDGRRVFAQHNVNDGLHYVLGFETYALDTTTTADHFGQYLHNGYTFRSAWINATRDGHNSSYTAAYIRFTNASCNTRNDKLAHQSCDPTSGSSVLESSWSL